jgi:hypothetical protein
MVDDAKKACPVCNLPDQILKSEGKPRQNIILQCKRCGHYSITTAAIRLAEKMQIRTKLSAWIRNLNELGMDVPEINTKRLKEIETSIPEYNPSDKQYLFLRSLSRKLKHPMDHINIIHEWDYPLAWAADSQEMLFYVRFLIERGFLVRLDDKIHGNEASAVSITPSGWNYLDQYRERAVELSQAYVMMPISKEMDFIWEREIKPAINDAGYKAIRIESKTHDDKINAKILSDIKDSLFLVAEVSTQNPTFYFGAGFAAGKNIPVIWVVEKNAVCRLHIDAHQYNFLLWKNPDELREKLYNHICVVVGRRKQL